MELQKKRQGFGMLIFIAKTKPRDGNFFEDRDVIINKVEYDPELKKKVKQEGLRLHKEVQKRVSEEEKKNVACFKDVFKDRDIVASPTCRSFTFHA